MTGLASLVATYSDQIDDGRTLSEVFNHMGTEMSELRDEIAATFGTRAPGPDGIFGEAIDIIACALDLIRLERPDATPEELDAEVNAYMHRKCQKWVDKYG